MGIPIGFPDKSGQPVEGLCAKVLYRVETCPKVDEIWCSCCAWAVTMYSVHWNNVMSGDNLSRAVPTEQFSEYPLLSEKGVGTPVCVHSPIGSWIVDRARRYILLSCMPNLSHAVAMYILLETVTARPRLQRST